MKKLLGLVFALLAVFTLMGCEVETIIEEKIEVVEVERIVVETVVEKMTEQQKADIETLIEAEVVARYQEEYYALNEALENQFEEELAQAIEDLEPVIKWRDKIVEKVEYVYVHKDMGEYTDQQYIDLKSQLEGEISTLSGLVEAKDLEINTLQTNLQDALDGIAFLEQFILDVADGAKLLQVHVGIPEETIYPSYQELFSAIGAEYTVLEGEIAQLELELQTTQSDVEMLETQLATAEGDITDLETQLADAQGVISTLEVQLADALEMVDYLHQFILQVAEDAKLLQIHVGIDENTVYASYEEMFNAIAGAYTLVETERDVLLVEVADLEGQLTTVTAERDDLTSELATLQSTYEDTLSALALEEGKVSTLTSEKETLEAQLVTANESYDALLVEKNYLESIVNDDIKPVLGAVTLTNDEVNNLVLTVNASDNVGLKSLEVDHNVVTIPEFTVYTEDILASEETFGASMVYVDGVWTINFGPTMTAEIRNHATVTFYFVIKDLANNQFGNMYYVQPEMTVELVVPVPDSQ